MFRSFEGANEKIYKIFVVIAEESIWCPFNMW